MGMEHAPFIGAGRTSHVVGSRVHDDVAPPYTVFVGCDSACLDASALPNQNQLMSRSVSPLFAHREKPAPCERLRVEGVGQPWFSGAQGQKSGYGGSARRF